MFIRFDNTIVNLDRVDSIRQENEKIKIEKSNGLVAEIGFKTAELAKEALDNIYAVIRPQEQKSLEDVMNNDNEQNKKILEGLSRINNSLSQLSQSVRYLK